MNIEIIKQYSMKRLPSHVIFNNGNLFFAGSLPFKDSLSALSSGTDKFITEEEIAIQMGVCPHIDEVSLPRSRLKDICSIINDSTSKINSLKNEVATERRKLRALKTRRTQSEKKVEKI